MRSRTRITVSTFGVLAAIAGLEHGIGEALQGNVTPEGVVIESWAGSEPFQILAGEPAMTLIPNLLVSGILTIVLSLVFLVWVVWFVHRKHGGLALIGLSLVLLLVGGGFGPPLLGIILGAVATRIGAPLTLWRKYVPVGLRRVLVGLWPWFLGLGLVAWLMLFPGLVLVEYSVGVPNPEVTVSVVMIAAFLLLFLTIFAALSSDSLQECGARWAPALRRG